MKFDNTWTDYRRVTSVFLVTGTFQNCPLVAGLAARRTDLHKVIQGVMEYLAQSCDTPHLARLALGSLAVVIHALLPHLEDKLRDPSTFIIKTLLHVLTCYTSSLHVAAPYLAGEYKTVTEHHLKCCR